MQRVKRTKNHAQKYGSGSGYTQKQRNKLMPNQNHQIIKCLQAHCIAAVQSSLPGHCRLRTWHPAAHVRARRFFTTILQSSFASLSCMHLQPGADPMQPHHKTNVAGTTDQDALGKI